jgi:DNA-binding transcriptional LysR family regulator
MPDVRPPRPRLDELGIFVEVAAAGSLAGAARRLGVPKSTIGRAIARLEQELRTALVGRQGRGPALTEAGRALAAQAAPHVAALQGAAAAVIGAEVHGTLRLTATSDLAQVVLGPLVAVIVARYPQLTVEVDATVRVVDLAAEGIDLALRVAARTLPASALVARKLARLDLGLFASPLYLAQRGTPRRADELPAHAHVLLQGRHGKATLVLDGPHGVERVAVRGQTSANDFYFMREAMLGGAGIGPLSWMIARAEVAAGRLVRVLPEHRLAGATAYVVHLPLRPLPAKIDAFKRLLLQHAPRLLAEPG